MFTTIKIGVAAALLCAVPVMADDGRVGGTSARLERVSRVEAAQGRLITAQPLVYRSSSGAEATRRQLDPQPLRSVVLASSREKPNPPIISTQRVYTNDAARAMSPRAGVKLAGYERLQVVDSRPIDAASPAPLPVNERYTPIDAASPRPEPVTYRNASATPASYRVGVGFSEGRYGSRAGVGFSYSSGYSRYYNRGYNGYTSYGCAPVYSYAPVYCPPPVVYYRPVYCAPVYRPYYRTSFFRSSCRGPRVGFSFSFRGRF
jgi:hypothetical protein